MAPKPKVTAAPTRHLNLKTHPHPRALDLFCGGGGAGLGLSQAGFKTVVGIDRSDHASSYEHAPGMKFLQADIQAITPEFLKQFDFVWASPPCQAHSSMVFKHQRDKFLRKWQREGRHMDYIPFTRTLLQLSGVPFVIENVGGAKRALSGDLLKLCGTMMEPPLQVFRHRFFERGNGMPTMKQPECRHENCRIGSLGKKDTRAALRPPLRRCVSEKPVKEQGGAPPGFRRVERRYASHPERVDYVYYGKTEEITAKIKAKYRREYCRSAREVHRVLEFEKNVGVERVQDDKQQDEQQDLHEQQDLDKQEVLDEQQDLHEQQDLDEQELDELGGADDKEEGNAGSSFIQMYPIYGLQLARGKTSEWRMAMGLDEDHMTRDEIRESIPPAYSKYIGKIALAYLKTCKQHSSSSAPLNKRKEKIVCVECSA